MRFFKEPLLWGIKRPQNGLRSREQILKPIKILRIFLSVGHPRDPKEERAIWVTIKKKEKKIPRFLPKIFLDSTFWTSKMTKTRMSIWSKMVDFLIQYGFLSSNIAFLGPGKNFKSFPLIAKEI